MFQLVLHIFSNIVGVMAASYFIGGFTVPFDFLSLMKIGLILGVINFFLKPIAKLILSPFILITLGLFTIVINMAALWLATIWAPEMRIEGLEALFWATLMISAVNFLIHFSAKKIKK